MQKTFGIVVIITNLLLFSIINNAAGAQNIEADQESKDAKAKAIFDRDNSGVEAGIEARGAKKTVKKNDGPRCVVAVKDDSRYYSRVLQGVDGPILDPTPDIPLGGFRFPAEVFRESDSLIPEFFPEDLPGAGAPFDPDQNIRIEKSISSDTGRWLACEGIDYLIPVNLSDPVALAEFSYINVFARVEPGLPRVSTNNPQFETYAGFPIFFAVDQDYWRTYSDSETFGGVSVTVNLTPKQVIIDPKDSSGEIVVCDNPGRLWEGPMNSKEFRDNAWQKDFPCSYKYVDSSFGRDSFDLEVSVVFDVDVQTSPAGLIDKPADWSTTAVFPTEIKEIHALNTEPS